MRNRFMIEGVSVSPDHFINGKRVSSPSTFETRCPFDWANKLADIYRRPMVVTSIDRPDLVKVRDLITNKESKGANFYL